MEQFKILKNIIEIFKEMEVLYKLYNGTSKFKLEALTSTQPFVKSFVFNQGRLNIYKNYIHLKIKIPHDLKDKFICNFNSKLIVITNHYNSFGNSTILEFDIIYNDDIMEKSLNALREMLSNYLG